MFMLAWGCKAPQVSLRSENRLTPTSYKTSLDTTNVAFQSWRNYFADPYLAGLIEEALSHNQELNIVRQEIEISRNEVLARRGEYRPFVRLRAGTGIEKEGRYTRNGSVEEQLDIRPGRHFPTPLPDVMLGAYATWELDIWHKLRNATQSAMYRYMASVEGKNFVVTNLVAELAEGYYELMALDNLLHIIEQNIGIQTNALRVVRQQKEAAKVSQLAVNRFEAQLLNTQNLRYDIQQKITETENRLNFLAGRQPQPIQRSSEAFEGLSLGELQAGVPSQLLLNRPDIRQAEANLQATKLNVSVARANFLPSVGISAGVGLRAFNPVLLLRPESILFNTLGDLVAPLVNKNAIQAQFNTATAQQIQAVVQYEQAILNAHVDVLNQLAKIDNYTQSYDTKKREVEILQQSVNIANSLFNSARADYAEVLLTQREALDAKIDLVEVKLKQLHAKVNIYRALGGGWR